MKGRIFDSIPQTRYLSARCVRLGLRAAICSGGTPDRSKLNYWTDGTIPWISSGEVSQGLITRPTDHITDIAVRNSSTKRFPAGSTVIALAGQGKTKASVAQMGMEAYGNQSLACIYEFQGSNRFLFWWLASLYREVRGLSSQDTRDGLNQSIIRQLPIPNFPDDVQNSIAQFLDREISQIDELIKKKLRMVELLDEKRLTLITEAVSGRFNQKIVRTDRLISRREVVCAKPIKYAFSVSRRMIDPQIYDDSLVYYYSLPTWHETGTGSLQCAHDIHSAKMLLQGGEVLVSKLNPGKGAVILSTRQNVPSICSTEFIVLKAAFMLPRFAFYLMSSVNIRSLLKSTVESVTNSHKRARVDRFLSNRVNIFPREIQNAIADFLDLKICEIVALKLKTLASIKRHRELRTALITTAVTGRIDIDHWRKGSETDRRIERINERSDTCQR